MSKLSYIRIRAEILSRRDLSANAKLLLALIQSFGSKGLYMSNAQLAEALGLNARTISSLLGHLAGRGLIAVVHPQSRFRRIFFEAAGSGRQPRCSDKPTAQIAAAAGQKPASTAQVFCSDCEGFCHHNLKEVNRNVTLKRTPSASSGRQVSEGTIFEQFWQAYPRKAAKQAARQAFARLAPDEKLAAVMLEALEQQKASPDWQREGGRFIPYPARWLSGRRWEDQAADPMAGLTHPVSEEELDRLLGVHCYA
jgi:DNA-binding MarR family transcriptional regulator